MATVTIEALEMIAFELELMSSRLQQIDPARLTAEEKKRALDFRQQVQTIWWKVLLPSFCEADVTQVIYEITNFINGIDHRLQEH